MMDAMRARRCGLARPRVLALSVLVAVLALVAPVSLAAACRDPGAPANAQSVALAALVRAPAFASRVPDRTRQVVRTVKSRRWCAKRWCTETQAWAKQDDGRWVMLRRFRSTIGPRGFGKTREGDMRSPSGVYRIKITFSTGRRAPGPMPWRRRKPTSIVTSYPNRLYNTWIEERGRTSGDRLSMRHGFIVNYNRPRLRVGVGPKPVIGKGSGIFYHTSMPGRRWVATAGCTQLGNPKSMRWVVRWLRPDAHPRVVQAL